MIDVKCRTEMDGTDNNMLPHRLRRRRGPSFITKVACTECRKGKAKCDGQDPCARCTSKGGLVCVYNTSVHACKEDMRREISELRDYRRQSENILALLANGDHADLVISKLQQEEPLEDILEQLGRQSPDVESLKSGFSSQQRRESTQSYGSRSENQQMTDHVSGSQDEAGMDCFKYGSRWSELSLSDTVIEHLLLLYFCWEYPIFSSISKRHFVKDFNMGHGRFCSSLLVHGMLAVACRFSDQAEIGMDPDDDTAGMLCYLEAERLLSTHHGERSVTIVQTMGLMSTWNASRGDYRKARYLAGQAMRMAIEMGLHHDSDNEGVPDNSHEVHNTAFWGTFMLDQAWSLATGCLPQVSRDGLLTREHTAFDRDELREWIPYAGNQIPHGLDLRQPSNVRAVYKSLCELSTIIHSALYVMYTDTDSFTSRDILDVYTRMLGWYSSLPEVLRLGENSTPSVLFVHMYYHFSIILTFYRLRSLRFVDSKISALEVCTDAAKAIITLVRSYESLYGLRRTPCFLPYIIFSSGIAHIGTTDLKINIVDRVTHSAQEVAVLQLMSLYHGSAKHACRTLLSRTLYPNLAGGKYNKVPEKDAHSSWDPFVATMNELVVG